MTALSGDLGGLAVTNETQRANTSLAGHIKEDVEGSVIVGKLYRFDADGAIKSTFQAALPGGANLFIINTGSTTSGASINCGSGNIKQVAVTGNCAGAISATAGDVLLVDVGGNLTATVRANAGALGDILVDGALDVPSAGGDSGIRSRDGANRIVGDTMTSATDIGLVVDDGPGVLGLLAVNSGGIPNGCVINCKSLTAPVGGGDAGILIAGDLAGDIVIHDGGDVEEMIWIGGSLTATGSIDYQKFEGLTNQIIINGLDDGGEWDGVVRIDGYDLEPANAPYYIEPSSDFGRSGTGRLSPLRQRLHPGERRLARVHVHYGGRTRLLRPVGMGRSDLPAPGGDFLQAQRHLDVDPAGR